MKWQWKPLSIAYIILIVVLTVSMTGWSILIYRNAYVAGTRNFPAYFLGSAFVVGIMFFYVLLPIAMGASILALVNLVHRHSSVGQVLLKLIMILLGPVIVFCSFLCSPPAAWTFLKGFEQWVVQEADIDAIQTWLASEGAKHAGQLYPKGRFHEELPECLLELNPAYISFSDSDTYNGPSVEIGWRFFNSDYGLIVGSPAMETPEEGRISLGGSNCEFRRPVKRGAYVFDRG